MFNNRREKEKEEEEINSNNFIGKGTVIEGNIIALGSMRIEGKIMGNVQSKSKIVLGESGSISGDLVSSSAEIEGSITGNVNIKDVLILKSTARLVGDVIIKKLVVANGASFNGVCKMGESKSHEEPKPVVLPVDNKK